MDMASEDSLDRSIDIAVQHYSSLFRLPSHRKVLLLLALLCIGGALVSTVVRLKWSKQIIKTIFD